MTPSDLQKWHLAEDSKEASVAEFELQLWRIFNGFVRWVEECERSANNTGLSALEIAILHIIRMKGRPKSASDIEKLLNKTDTIKVIYAIRKLLKLGLIAKSPTLGKSTRSMQYIITEAGKKNTTAYKNVRFKLLINKFYGNEISIEDMVKTIAQLKTVYEEAEHSAAFHDYYEENPTPKKQKKSNNKKQ